MNLQLTIKNNKTLFLSGVSGWSQFSVFFTKDLNTPTGLTPEQQVDSLWNKGKYGVTINDVYYKNLDLRKTLMYIQEVLNKPDLFSLHQSLVMGGRSIYVVFNEPHNITYEQLENYFNPTKEVTLNVQENHEQKENEETVCENLPTRDGNVEEGTAYREDESSVDQGTSRGTESVGVSNQEAESEETPETGLSPYVIEWSKTLPPLMSKKNLIQLAKDYGYEFKDLGKQMKTLSAEFKTYIDEIYEPAYAAKHKQ